MSFGFRVSSLALLLVAFAAGLPLRAGDPGVITLTEKNCVLGFEIGSTWHLVKGEVRKLSGSLRYGRAGDLNTLRGTIEVDAAAMETGNADRDRKMREFSLDTNRFPKITYTIEGAIVSEGSNIVFSGHVTIRDVTRPLVLGAQYSTTDGQFRLIGGAELKWADFGVRDPSTFFAKLQPSLKVMFDVTLPRQ